jgi:hypothetical protein
MHTTGQTSLTSFRTSRSHFNVYEQNVGKIGLLKAPLPEKIVCFYTLVFSVLEDFEDIGKGRYRNSAVLKASNQLKELRDILEEGILLGNEIRTLIKPPA